MAKEITIKRPIDDGVNGVVKSEIKRYGRFNWWTDVKVTGVLPDNRIPIALPDYGTDTYFGNRFTAFIFRKYNEIAARRSLRAKRRPVAVSR